MPIKKLTILHSNDMHGDFLPKIVDGKSTGGLSRLSGYVNHVREEQENVIYAIAGDMFRGSIIDEDYQGLSTIDLINQLRPDVVTIGNHEVDYGISHLLFLHDSLQTAMLTDNLQQADSCMPLLLQLRSQDLLMYRKHYLLLLQ